MNYDIDNFSKNLKRLRGEAGLSRKDLSKATGVAESTIKGYEINRVYPSLYIAIEIASALDKKLEELCGEPQEAEIHKG